MIREKIEINGRELVVETGMLAKQASGSAVVKYGDTVVLAACCASDSGSDLGFFPLTVDYRERTYAAGKIPGGFFKREGRPSATEILTSRLIDRPLRPLFPEGYSNEVQISLTVLSHDEKNDPSIPAMIAASCAVALSPVPFDGPVGAVRIGRVGDSYIINPTLSELEESELDLVVAGTESGIAMLEGGSKGTSEKLVLGAIELAKETITQTVELQKKIVSAAGKEKAEFIAPEKDEDYEKALESRCAADIMEVLRSGLSKDERKQKIHAIHDELTNEIQEKYEEDPERLKEELSKLSTYFSHIEKNQLRKLVVEEKLRVDGRKPEELRPISCYAGILPRTHGSGVFTKGETQSLSVLTLGTSRDQQIIDALEGEYKKSFMLHYNFPAFSVGEVRPNRGVSRREMGHGMLAEKAIRYILPDQEEFPYTIRLVSDILESNGSSSMATVCAGCIALMDAGVPIKDMVAGVGMGIIDGVILSDMLGDEDHAGDMDFKVAGTRDNLTAIQMDIKIKGISMEILEQALEQAKHARIHTLDEISKVIASSRESISEYAPQIKTVNIDPKKIGTLIGPGGKMIKSIQESTGAEINIEDDGTVAISASTKEMMEEALELVEKTTAEAEPGKVYEGVVKTCVDFGAFVEILPGKDGLVHISELAPYRVNKVTDEVNVGDKVTVKCIGVDDRGKIKLSRAVLMKDNKKDAKQKEE